MVGVAVVVAVGVAVGIVSNCINGKDNFINSINVDFSPLYEATPSEIEQFKTELQELINKYDKERTD